MGGRSGNGNRNSSSNESWRNEKLIYQEKTLGGIYFYQSPPSKTGHNFATIDPNLYKRLPKYAQQSVLSLDSTGVSISGYFMTDEGIVYMNHMPADFWQYVRLFRNRWKNANGKNDWNSDDVVEYIQT